jgi:dinuclear metal center YbgI/SA1388 family protein
MKVADLVRALEMIAPPSFAAPWDNVGLLVGDEQSALTRVMLAIDCTRAVLDEARQESCDAIVSYHPPIFQPTKRFTAGSIAYELARAGIALYSPHTALDAASGGTNDLLAQAVAMVDPEPLRALEFGESEVKLVTFVPQDHVEALSRSLFAAGAGRIGDYSSCSFRTKGMGTFFGEEGANPVVGEPGRLQETEEVRLETVVPLSRLKAVVSALRLTHPYEEPAFDLIRLAATPGGPGYGRVGLVQTAPTRMVIDRAKRALGLAHVLVAGPLERDVYRVAVCAGSGGDLLGDAIASGAQLFLTGELRHHDALRAVSSGLTVVCALHSASERGVLIALERRLAEHLPNASFVRSRSDQEPFVFM